MVSSPWSHGRGHHNDVYCDLECCYSDEPEHLHLGVGAGLRLLAGRGPIEIGPADHYKGLSRRTNNQYQVAFD